MRDATNTIPPMTHPLGKHWDQPRDITAAPMDDDHVLLTSDQMRRLANYESSLPSGVYEGKCWRRGPQLCWYGPSERVDHCQVFARDIVEVTP